jgi:hypothetical protein
MAILAMERSNYAPRYIALDSEVTIVLDTVILSTGAEVAFDYRLEFETERYGSSEPYPQARGFEAPVASLEYALSLA